jgi:tRNA-splicing ligase RtcB
MKVEPCVLNVNSDLGSQYLLAMNLAGDYAHAERDWVCDRVAKILGAEVVDVVHNHHNFAWHEKHGDEMLWVVRKGPNLEDVSSSLTTRDLPTTLRTNSRFTVK